MRTKMSRTVVLFAVGVACTAGLVAGAASSVSASGLTPPIWTVNSNPNPPNASQSSLGGVSCIGPSFCVAVGSSAMPGPQSTLAERWNGRAWAIVSSPNPSGAAAVFTGVSCTSTSDCLAVGWSQVGSGPEAPLAEVWNGSAWSILNVPAPADGGTLSGISCAGPTECFAVGTQLGSSGSVLIEEWNGSLWTPSSASSSSSGIFWPSGISCSGPNACLAVGTEGMLDGRDMVSRYVAFAEQWNGVSWSATSPANVLSDSTYLDGVSCNGPTSCTAVGVWQASPYFETLVEKWNGSSWSIVPSPNEGAAGTTANDLSGISCVGPDFCAAVGFVEAGGSGFDIPYSLIETWNGSSWVIGTPQDLSPPLLGTACTAALVCTAVGDVASPDGSDLSAGVSTNGQVRPFRVVGMASNPTEPGYREAGSDGSVAAYGSSYLGSLGGERLNQPIVGIAPTPSGNGYWEVAADGGVFTFGDAQYYGSTGALHLNKPIVGMASTPDGKGYWLVASDGGIFSFGDAQFHGSTGTIHLNQPVVGMAATTDGQGYWLVASDGGIFSFGDAQFYGSTGAIHLNQPVVGMAATTDGNGYWLVASDGGIFSFGDAPFLGTWQ
jgi:hypothetical protein